MESSKIKAQSSKEVQNPKRKPFDLEERTAIFGEDIIKFAKKLPYTEINHPLIKQLVRSSTSIGANYMEADGARSKKDFFNKLSICCKEAKETKHWLRMISAANPPLQTSCRIFWQETHELICIFSSIIKKKR